MHFTDDAIILSVRKFGDHGALARVLTANHGLFAGIDRFGLSSRRRGIWQPGNRVRVEWRARLSEHLGSFTAELAESVAAYALDDRLKLAVLQSACELSAQLLNEREPQPDVWKAMDRLMREVSGNRLGPSCDLPAEAPVPHGSLYNFASPFAKASGDKSQNSDEGASFNILFSYVHLELTLLKTSGFGLDLARCAATGSPENLLYVSPKTGRAVSKEAGEAYKEKLFRLPGLFRNERASPSDLQDALLLTGYFLETRALAARQVKLPMARRRVLDMLTRGAEEIQKKETA